MLIRQLPYHEDSASLFARIAHQPWAVFLDSVHPGSAYGRYDIISCNPFMTLSTAGELTRIVEPGCERCSEEDPFDLLQGILQRNPAQVSELPFCGGAIGYFSYDLARRLERLPALAIDTEQMPEMAIGIYDWAVIVDHRTRQTRLVGQGNDPATDAKWDDLAALFSAPAPPATDGHRFSVTSAVTSNMDAQGYRERFARVQAYIRNGDCYQVNLAQRFSAAAEGDPWQAYLQLREISPAPFACYLNTPAGQVLSASPERFLSVRRGRVQTRPIKGTRPRSNDPLIDRANAEDLAASLKDRAENLMIVDLLRNDIGKNCAVGSVSADRLFALESYANVHHLVSTVTGVLALGRDPIDLLRGCFPGGSITGAPKLRAMQIIEELEPHRRGVYCGAIGYIGFDGSMDTSIAIRTAVYSHGALRFWAGGGVVADSEADKEYRETWDKASGMLALTERCGAPRVGR